MWVISFISLYICIFWFVIILHHRTTIHGFIPSKKIPKVSIILPAYNEERIIAHAIESLLKIDYPREKLEIIVVNDGSTDRTKDIAEEYARQGLIKLINQKNAGKAAALNRGIEEARGEIVGCMDADSIVSPDALKKLIGYFENKNIGAAISAIYPIKTKNILERLQKIEYILANMYRKLMVLIGTMYITPGAFSLYRKSAVKKFGGFDIGNLTEDLEIALKLRYNGYAIENSFDATSKTELPSTWKSFYKQRIRWYRGLVYNTKKYKDMILNPKFGYLGMFQIPMNILFPFIALIAVIMLFYSILYNLYLSWLQLSTTGLELIEFKWSVDIIQWLMHLDFKTIFPFFVLLVAAFILVRVAYKYAKENMKDVFVLVVFFIFYFTIINVIWSVAIFKELTRSEKKW